MSYVKDKKQDYYFVGIISSYYQWNELKPLKKHAEKYFAKGGAIVYTYSKYDEMQSFNYLKKLWGVDLNNLQDRGKIIPICREDYLVDNHIDGKGFLQAIERALDELIKNGSKKKIVYITIDSFWDSIVMGKNQYIYDELRNLCKKRKIQMVFRYIMEELSEEHIVSLMKNHRFLLVDGIEEFKIYSPRELLSQSLILFSRYASISRKYNQEMMRVEYLKTLGELMEGTVHDMNNMLVSILGYSQLCLSIDDRKQIENYLEIMYKTALDGRCIVDRIKNHIRGSCVSIKDLYEFDYIMNTCIDMIKYKFKSILRRKKGQINLELHLNSRSSIYANEYEVRQAIINIILNGIDAMETSGVLTLKTYDIEDQVVLEIIDTGKGMDENTKLKLFEPYFSTKGSNGTGLGLNIAKKVFDNHNAKIHVDSKIGKGTKFTIYFPIVESKANVAKLKCNSYNIN